MHFAARKEAGGSAPWPRPLPTPSHAGRSAFAPPAALEGVWLDPRHTDSSYPSPAPAPADRGAPCPMSPRRRRPAPAEASGSPHLSPSALVPRIPSVPVLPWGRHPAGSVSHACPHQAGDPCILGADPRPGTHVGCLVNPGRDSSQGAASQGRAARTDPPPPRWWPRAGQWAVRPEEGRPRPP